MCVIFTIYLLVLLFVLYYGKIIIITYEVKEVYNKKLKHGIFGGNMAVNFYETVKDECLKFAVIIAKYNGKYVFCKHKSRNTLEIPGGHRETGESIDETAKRELIEETGAIDFKIVPICIYSVANDNKDGDETFGKLYFADIYSLASELHSEIESVVLLEGYPNNWTYPTIQPHLIEKAKQLGFI